MGPSRRSRSRSSRSSRPLSRARITSCGMHRFTSTHLLSILFSLSLANAASHPLRGLSRHRFSGAQSRMKPGSLSQLGAMADSSAASVASKSTESKP